MPIKLNAKDICATIVESMLPRFSDKNLGLHMILNFRYEDMGFDESGNTIVRELWKKSYKVELLFLRPNNYTKVLGRVFDDQSKIHMLNRTKEEVILKQYADHDSCWRSSGFDEFFKTFMNAVESYKKDRNGLDLRDNLNEFHGFYLFSGNPKYLELEYAEVVDRENRWNSDYKVKLKKELTIKEAAKLMP